MGEEKELYYCIHPQVYVPSDDTYMLLDYLERFQQLYTNRRVLEIGSGTGVVSAYMLRYNPLLLVSVDINPIAVETTKCTLDVNGLDGNILVGDLCSPFSLHVKFDLIVFNPPYLPEDEYCGNELLDVAWCGGKEGIMVLDRFLSQSKKHVHRDSKIIFIVSSLSNYKSLLDKYHDTYHFEKIMEKQFFFEKIMLYEASPK